MLPNVLILKSTLDKLGGLEKYSLRLAQAFSQAGCQTTVVTTGTPPPILKQNGIRVESHDFSHKLSFLKVKEFDKFCMRCHTQHPSSLVFGLDRSRYQTHIRAGNGVHAAYLNHRKESEGIIKSLSFALNPLHRLILSIEKESFERPELRVLFTNSHMVKKDVLTYYNVPEEKISVIHNGVEWEEMKGPFSNWKQTKTDHLRSLGLSENTYHFLFVGHNFKRKGLDLLIESLSTLKSKDFHLSVIGKDKHSAFYQDKIEKLGLSKHVTLYGERRDVISFYQMCDALIIPSLYDPFANVTLEALAMGLFVVSSKTNGAHEIIQPDAGVTLPSIIQKEAMTSALNKAIDEHKKTENSSFKIRETVKHLDFSTQLKAMVESSLEFIV